MLPHELFTKYNIVFIGFPDKNKKIKGVYNIGDFYIGASSHIRKRIIQHFLNIRTGYGCNRVIEGIQNKKQIIVKYEFENPNDEMEISKKYGVNISRERFYHQLFKP